MVASVAPDDDVKHGSYSERNLLAKVKQLLEIPLNDRPNIVSQILDLLPVIGILVRSTLIQLGLFVDLLTDAFLCHTDQIILDHYLFDLL